MHSSQQNTKEKQGKLNNESESDPGVKKERMGKIIFIGGVLYSLVIVSLSFLVYYYWIKLA